jgi:hypothetical protein
MDRRRFVPSPEGLEGRALLSVFGNTSSKASSSSFLGAGSLSTTVSSIPVTFQAKELRIDHLPFYLERIRPGRFLPTDALSALQTDLHAITGTLHWPGPGPLEIVNHDMRVITAHPSLSPTDANILNRSLGNVLRAGGATPEATASIQADMTALARVDAASPQPVFLATNDYSLVIQTLLGIGRPIERPTVPALKAGTGTRVDAYDAVTGHKQPILVGTYDAVQATSTAKVVATTTSMQIVDANGNVYGTTLVDTNGDYAVQFAKPLTDGLYTFYVRAVDDQGHMSNFSPPYKLKIITTHNKDVAAESLTPPGGPLALRP